MDDVSVNLRAMAGLAVTLVALGIGLVATYSNVAQCRGPRERAYVIRHCVFAWLAIVTLLGLAFALPPPYRYVPLLLYFVHLPLAIYRFAGRHQLVRRLESIESARRRAGRAGPPAAPGRQQAA
jgi:cell division protein FtsW (lipid II flippase)